MKLAKKTLSVALAAVMAASSLAGTVSAFAIEPIQVTPSAVKYTALVNGQATVKPNVTINNDFAKEAKDLDDQAKEANFNAQIDKTSLSSYYSFTPAKTGYYNMHVESTPVFYGYSQDIYSKYKKAGYGAADAIKYAHVYQSTPDGLFSTYTEVKEAEKLTGVTFDKTKALKDTDAEDSVTIDNVYTAVDEEKTERDPFVVYDELADHSTVAPKAESKFDTKDETGFVLSYKYTKFNGQDYIIPDKHVPTQGKGRGIELVNDGLLQAGKTYYFKATLKKSHVVTREENKNAKKNDAIYNYAVKSTAAPSAKITISRSQGLNYHTKYTLTEEKDYQVLACPAGTSIEIDDTTYTSDYDVKYGKSVVKLPVYKTSAVANYYGDALKVTVADTYQNDKVEVFNNRFGGLQTVVLGKNVKTVTGLSKTSAPQLKSIEIKNPEFVDFAGLNVDADKVTFTVPANTPAWYAAVTAGYKVNVTCAHKWVVTKAATIFATGTKKCSECDAVATVAKVRFAPTAKASKKKIVVKGNAGKVAKLAVWVYNSNGKLVKKQVKKNVTKNTVKVAKAGKYTVKVKAYGPNGAKTASVKKTVKVK